MQYGMDRYVLNSGESIYYDSVVEHLVTSANDEPAQVLAVYIPQIDQSSHATFDRTLSDWLEYWAEKTPDREHIVYSDRNLRFTWKTFNERVDNMANGLLSIGVTQGTHVGIWAQNVPDWLTLLYATAKIGAVAVTVNTNYKSEELAFVLKNADMHTLCLTEGIPGSDYIDMIYELLPELRTHSGESSRAAGFPNEKRGLYRTGEVPGMYNTAELLLAGSSRPKDH